MAAPPKCAGIYLLANQKLGKLYVGQAKNLHRRYQDWRMALQTMGCRSFKVAAAIVGTNIEDWEFSVLCIASPADLDKLERRAIEAVRQRRPADILNFAPQPRQRGVGSSAKSKIIGPDGAELTRGAAADLLGVRDETVKKRLQALRTKGIFEVKISGDTPAKLTY